MNDVFLTARSQAEVAGEPHVLAQVVEAQARTEAMARLVVAEIALLEAQTRLAEARSMEALAKMRGYIDPVTQRRATYLEKVNEARLEAEKAAAEQTPDGGK